MNAPQPRRRIRDRLRAALLIGAIGLSACSSAFEGPGQEYALAGGQVHLWCDGDGDQTVVFLSAIGGDHTLVGIAERLAGDATVCFYDRPGDGETEPPDAPRSAASDAADLHELLDAAEIRAPVALVAHSYGGLVAVVAAAEHPEDVAGVVLIDASEPDAEERFYAVMTEGQRAYFDGQKENFPYVDWPTSLDQARTAVPDFPDVPLAVITASRAFLDPCDPELPCEDLQALWMEAQAAYATLTSDARHVLAETGHYVHEDDPDLVLSEIRALLERAAASDSSLPY